MLDVVAAPAGAVESGCNTPAAIALLPGGSGANVAAWLAHLGAAVVLAARVGRDSHAEHSATLRRAGVAPAFALDEQKHTGIIVTLLDAAGERSFLTDRGANANLCAADLPLALLERMRLVHVSGYALLEPGARAAVRGLLNAAAERGLPCSVDLASADVIRRIGPAMFFESTRSAALCFGNTAEATALTGSADVREQCARLAARYALAVVTLGARGAAAGSNGGAAYSSCATTAQPAIDTTGAGDAFTAGFLVAHLSGAPVGDCLAAGVRAGSFAVGRYGGRPPQH